MQAQEGQAGAPAAGAAPAGRQGGGGRGRQAGPPIPTPRLPDGTVNLGRVPGEKGTYSVPYITNMAMRVVGPDGQPLPEMVKYQQEQQAAAAPAHAAAVGLAAGAAAPSPSRGCPGCRGPQPCMTTTRRTNRSTTRKATASPRAGRA